MAAGGPAASKGIRSGTGVMEYHTVAVVLVLVVRALAVVDHHI